MSEPLVPLPFEDANVIVVEMLKPSKAVDLYLGDLTRRSRSESGRTAESYRRILDKFTDMLEAQGDRDVRTISSDDCRRFLNFYLRRAPNYQALIYSILNSFLEWLYLQERIKQNPLDRVPRPRRVAAVDLDVVSVDTADVPLLLAAARTHTERLAVALPAYLGTRRRALAALRRRDYDPARRTIRAQDKGGKTITKPVPDELAAMIDAAITDGAITKPDDYLIPPEGLVTKAERDDRIIWRVVTRVADRAGVRCHVHALRAAFATFYLEQNPDELASLQTLLQHRSIATTQVYLRKLNRREQMEQVRSLSWNAVSEGTDAVLER